MLALTVLSALFVRMMEVDGQYRLIITDPVSWSKDTIEEGY